MGESRIPKVVLEVLLVALLAVVGVLAYTISSSDVSPDLSAIVPVSGISNGYLSSGFGVHVGNGTILTADHIGKDVDVMFMDDKWVFMKIITRNAAKDFAKFQMESWSDSMPAMTLCRNGPELGERVWYRVRLDTSVYGSVAARVMAERNRTIYMHGWIHVGMSGSGVVSDSGCVYGIVQSIGSSSGDHKQDFYVTALGVYGEQAITDLSR